jgi:hypothetical protein
MPLKPNQISERSVHESSFIPPEYDALGRFVRLGEMVGEALGIGRANSRSVEIG